MSAPDRKTRGRTRPGRLRALDAFLLQREAALLGRSEGEWARAVFVDVGFGEHPFTTLEAAAAFRTLNPHLQVVGVELEAERAARAEAAHADALTHFRQGGASLPAREVEPARLVRAMNLLRTYREEDVPPLHRALAAPLLPGGLLVEGSSDPEGSILTAHLLRRTQEGLTREALLFHTDFSHGFAPLLFRDWLPRDLRRRVRMGEPIHAFLSAWTQAWQEARAGGTAPPQDAFAASARLLAGRTAGVAAEEGLLAGGFLLWAPPEGVPP